MPLFDHLACDARQVLSVKVPRIIREVIRVGEETPENVILRTIYKLVRVETSRLCFLTEVEQCFG